MPTAKFRLVSLSRLLDHQKPHRIVSHPCPSIESPLPSFLFNYTMLILVLALVPAMSRSPRLQPCAKSTHQVRIIPANVLKGDSCRGATSRRSYHTCFMTMEFIEQINIDIADIKLQSLNTFLEYKWKSFSKPCNNALSFVLFECAAMRLFQGDGQFTLNQLVLRLIFM